MSSTDGLKRGMAITNTAAPISVPVGDGILGRVFNVTGDPVDERGPVEFEKRYPIHRKAPTLLEQDTSASILETGIKVIDLICPFSKGGKVGAFGGAGVGKTVVIMELINNIARVTVVIQFLPVWVRGLGKGTISTPRCPKPGSLIKKS